MEPQLVCSNSSNRCTCADEVGAPQCTGAERGFPAQDGAGRGLCCPDSAPLPAESAGAASRWAHVLGWAPTCPQPRSQLRGHRAAGDIPSNPQIGSSLQRQRSAEALGEPEVAALPHFRAWGAQQHRGFQPSSSSPCLHHRAAQWLPPVPLHRDHWAWKRRDWKQLGRQRDGTPARLVITARPRPSQAKPEPRGEQGKQEPPSVCQHNCLSWPCSIWVDAGNWDLEFSSPHSGMAGALQGSILGVNISADCRGAQMSPCRPLCPVSATSPAFPAGTLHPCSPLLPLGRDAAQGGGRMGEGQFPFPFWFWQMLPWLAKPSQGRAVTQRPEPPVPP